MAAFKDFEEIVAWQRAIDLSASVYPRFKDHRDFGFRDQILRASVSVANNIAEGFNSGSNRKFRFYLTIARSSCDEVRSMVILAERIGYLKREEVEVLRTECMRLNGTILSLIKSMRVD
ncbi:MAG: four helix bundle protein [Flavobacteriales bacterium]|nr:four helix bundle protein [Flavobacteriales bacterium]